MFSAKDLFFTPPAGGYTIAKSLRFRSSASAYLNRTPSSTTNQQTWTWSGWVKRGAIGGSFSLFTSAARPYNSTLPYFDFGFNSSDILYVQDYNGTAYITNLATTQVFRDVSAWYHIVIVCDYTNATQANRFRIYVNGGTQISAFGTNTLPANTTSNSNINRNIQHLVGAAVNNSDAVVRYLDGYLAEVNFIDGQALDPTYFGQTDTATGVWMPKAYTGTYGTNGFYLKFTDVGSTTAGGANTGYGKDFAGTNNWTTNNFGTTSTGASAVSYDSMYDTPTNYDNGVTGAGNYCVFNPLTYRNSTNTLSNANLTYAANSATDTSTFATFDIPSSTLIYFEAVYSIAAGAGNITYVGVSSVGDTGGLITTGSNLYSYELKNGVAYNQSSTTTYTAVTNGQTAMFAFDIANGKMWAGANGTWFNSGAPASGTGAILTSLPTTATSLFASLNGGATNRSQLDINFGQRPFAYTPPTGFKALCAQNLPTPTIGATSSTLANKYFDVSTWTGTGSATTIPLGSFSPDLVWWKCRNVAEDHHLIDAVRAKNGGTYYASLSSNLTAAEDNTSSGDIVTNISSSGLTVANLGGTPNVSTRTYVGWSWLANGSGSTGSGSGLTSITNSANASAGFSITTYTGNGTAGAYFNHGLGVAPKMVIVKQRTASSTTNWAVWHTTLANTEYLLLNTTAAKATGTTYWNSASVDNTKVTLGTSSDVNTNTGTYVAYCFAEVAGYSKFGSYTGNGSADGPMIYLGFRARWIMIRSSSAAGDWCIIDTARNTYNVVDLRLDANNTAVEITLTMLDINSNGFKIRTTNGNFNTSTATYIYAAFAESPFNYARAR